MKITGCNVKEMLRKFEKDLKKRTVVFEPAFRYLFFVLLSAVMYVVIMPMSLDAKAITLFLVSVLAGKMFDQVCGIVYRIAPNNVMFRLDDMVFVKSPKYQKPIVVDVEMVNGEWKSIEFEEDDLTLERINDLISGNFEIIERKIVKVELSEEEKKLQDIEDVDGLTYCQYKIRTRNDENLSRNI